MPIDSNYKWFPMGVLCHWSIIVWVIDIKNSIRSDVGIVCKGNIKDDVEKEVQAG